MTIAIGPEARTYVVTRQRALRRALETYGPLTRDALLDVAHAAHWHVPFEIVLERAVEAGRVRRLSDELFETGPEN